MIIRACFRRAGDVIVNLGVPVNVDPPPKKRKLPNQSPHPGSPLLSALKSKREMERERYRRRQRARVSHTNQKTQQVYRNKSGSNQTCADIKRGIETTTLI